MDQHTYQSGVKYAKSLLRQRGTIYTPKDLAHDAYLVCKGKEDYFIWAIKVTHLKRLRSLYTSNGKTGKNGYVGEQVLKHFVHISPTDAYDPDQQPERVYTFDNQLIDLKNVYHTLSFTERKVLLLRLQGFEVEEIQQKTNQSLYYTREVVKRIKNKSRTVLSEL